MGGTGAATGHSGECITHSLEPMAHSLECVSHSKERMAHSWAWTAHSLEWMTHSLERTSHSLEWITHSSPQAVFWPPAWASGRGPDLQGCSKAGVSPLAAAAFFGAAATGKMRPSMSMLPTCVLLGMPPSHAFSVDRTVLCFVASIHCAQLP